MTEEASSPYRKARTYSHLFALIGILVLIAWVGLFSGWRLTGVWVWTLVLLAAFAVVAGHGITDVWRGILIDRRNKMSLSRLQMVCWTLVILSSLLAAAMNNLSLESGAPLDIQIPSELWVLMGISTASLVASPAIISSRSQKAAPPGEKKKVAQALREQGYTDIDVKSESVVMSNLTPDAARWGDLLKGEEVGNATTIDLGKLQMFLFTFVLLLTYGAAVYQLMASGHEIEALPEVSEGMNVLLGISHTGYLAHKTVPQSATPSPSVASQGDDMATS